MDKLLTDDEVMKLIGGGSKMLTYPELSEFDNIDDVFGSDDKVVLLYVNTIKGNNISGHWTLLTRVKRGKKTIYEFMDPYGLMPDDQLKFYNKSWRKKSGQDANFLTRLLYQCSLNPNCEVHYNELEVQKDRPHVSTCGRHIAIRGHFYKIPLEKYQKIFKQMKNNGYDLDKVSVFLTEMLNNKNYN